MSINCLRSDRIHSAAGERPVVFVVDGSKSFRQAVEPVILSAGCLPRMAASAEEFLAYPRIHGPGCLLSELYLPGLSGMELQTLLAERTELPIIFMSRQVNVQWAVQAVKKGALGIFNKPLAHGLLLREVHHAIECSRAALRHLARLQVLRDRYDSLSAREREVMGFVVAGRLNKQIGGELGIAENTVKVHRCKLMRKMQTRSLAGLITMCMQLRLKGVEPLWDQPEQPYLS
jgi:FixJ family two-component response regulator